MIYIISVYDVIIMRYLRHIVCGLSCSESLSNDQLYTGNHDINNISYDIRWNHDINIEWCHGFITSLWVPLVLSPFPADSALFAPHSSYQTHHGNYTTDNEYKVRVQRLWVQRSKYKGHKYRGQNPRWHKAGITYNFALFSFFSSSTRTCSLYGESSSMICRVSTIKLRASTQRPTLMEPRGQSTTPEPNNTHHDPHNVIHDLP